MEKLMDLAIVILLVILGLGVWVGVRKSGMQRNRTSPE